MTGIDALEALKNNEIVFRGYFQSESEKWFVQYNKDTKSFSFGSGWNEALKFKSNEEILKFIFYTIMNDAWQKQLPD